MQVVARVTRRRHARSAGAMARSLRLIVDRRLPATNRFSVTTMPRRPAHVSALVRRTAGLSNGGASSLLRSASASMPTATLTLPRASVLATHRAARGQLSLFGPAL